MTKLYGFVRCILLDSPPVQLEVTCNGKQMGLIENGKKLLIDTSDSHGRFNFEIISNREIGKWETCEVDITDSPAVSTIPSRLRERTGWGFSVSSPAYNNHDDSDRDVLATIDIGYH